MQACREGLLQPHEVVPRPELAAMGAARQLQMEAAPTAAMALSGWYASSSRIAASGGDSSNASRGRCAVTQATTISLPPWRSTRCSFSSTVMSSRRNSAKWWALWFCRVPHGKA